MAYDPKRLSVLAYANGFTQWHYATPDDAVTGAGCFDAAAEMMRVGDLIVASVDTDGVATTVLYRVAANTGGAITVAAI